MSAADAPVRSSQLAGRIAAVFVALAACGLARAAETGSCLPTLNGTDLVRAEVWVDDNLELLAQRDAPGRPVARPPMSYCFTPETSQDAGIGCIYRDGLVHEALLPPSTRFCHVTQQRPGSPVELRCDDGTQPLHCPWW